MLSCATPPLKALVTREARAVSTLLKEMTLNNLSKQLVKADAIVLRKSVLQTKTSLKTKTPLSKKSGKIKGVSHTINWYKKKADIAYSKAIRARFATPVRGVRWQDWDVACITCKIVKTCREMQNGHFMSRQYNATRYCDQNTAPQCYGCNVMHQGRQYEFGLALDGLYGDGTAKEMYRMAMTPHQFIKAELIEIINDSKAECLFYEQK